MSDRTKHAADPLAGVVLHHLRVDWKNPAWEKHSLSNLFMGSQYHWLSTEHDWTRPADNHFGPAGEAMLPIEIERSILLELHPRPAPANTASRCISTC
jgi:hypothetical protein